MSDITPVSRRSYVIYVCALCGSDNIEASTNSDSLCGDCGEWMNCEPVRVVPDRSVDESQ